MHSYVIRKTSLKAQTLPLSTPLLQQPMGGFLYDISGFVDKLLGQGPVFCIDGIPDTWKIGLI